MGRFLRVQFPGAIYHVSTRGNERRLIFRDDAGGLMTAYTVYFNKRHHRAGHLTQGRFSAQMVEGQLNSDYATCLGTGSAVSHQIARWQEVLGQEQTWRGLDAELDRRLRNP